MANSKWKSWLTQEGSEKFGSKEFFKSYLFIIIGTFIYTAGDLLFAYPYHLAPGGCFGLSNVLNYLFPWKVYNYYYAMNIPLFIMGFILLGPRFGIKTIVSVLVSFAAIYLVETYWGYKPLIHSGAFMETSNNLPDGLAIQIEHDGRWFVPDYIINTLVGGLLYGIGIGMIFKAGATSGGSDIISMVINKYTHISLGTLVIIVDSTIALTSLLIAEDFRLPLYSVMLVYIEGKIIDMIVPPPPKKKKEQEITQVA